MSLTTTISIQFSIYAGFSIFGFGIIGNLINICLLFSTRSNSCSFILLIASIFNILALAFGLLPRVLSTGFSIDISSTNLIWCKSRLFFSYIGAIGALTCLCFASIDRYLVTCRSVIWRNRSKLVSAKIAIFITVSVLISMNIPFLIYYTIVQSNTSSGSIITRCSVVDANFALYTNYIVRPVFLGLLPGGVLIIIGLLTYRNITSLTNAHVRGTFQRTLVSMIFLQIIVVVIPIVPFAVFNIYQTLSSSITKSSYQLDQETLASNIGGILLYVSYASNFYVYLISASSYRQDFIQFVLFCYNQNHRNRRISPITRQQLELNTTSKIRHLRHSIQQHID